ncbi:MAG: tRNA (adenosine(37)-N6)-dimethylallyltransferase MiaA [Bacteroidota bacterium]|nr:tRNA (adenosine(37)-N6)-dimethylallyltransferase MiaA [Bacteroidota bacterium]
MTEYDLLVITGPTASGKTSLAAALAAKLDGEVISADSRQVYKRMDLGTGKDYNDYRVDGKMIPYHLIDIKEPGEKYNVFEYQRDFFKVLGDMRLRNKIPVACGGSGMYIDAIVSGYELIEVPPDPAFREALEHKSLEELTELLSGYKKLHNKTDIDTKKRAIRAIEIERFNRLANKNQTVYPEMKPLIIGIQLDRAARRKRISERLARRLKSGMVEEVRSLLDEGLNPESLIYYGLEYKFIILYLTGKMSYDEMVSSLEIAIHQFAKRQMTWFRGMERKGIKINWIDGELSLEIKVNQILKLLRSC